MPDDALADSGKIEDGLTGERKQVGLDGANEKGAPDQDFFDSLTDNLAAKGDEVAGNVGELGQRTNDEKGQIIRRVVRAGA